MIRKTDILKTAAVIAAVLCMAGCSVLQTPASEDRPETQKEDNASETEENALSEAVSEKTEETENAEEERGWPQDVLADKITFEPEDSDLRLEITRPEMFDVLFSNGPESVTGSKDGEYTSILGFYKVEPDTSPEKYMERCIGVDWMKDHKDYTRVGVNYPKVITAADPGEEGQGGYGDTKKDGDIWLASVQFDYRDTTVYLYFSYMQKGKDLVCVTMDCTTPKGAPDPIGKEDILDVWNNIRVSAG